MGVVNLSHVLTAQELLKRWPAVTEDELATDCLAAFLNDVDREVRFPSAYLHQKTLQSPEGNIYVCKAGMIAPDIKRDSGSFEIVEVNWKDGRLGGISKGIVFDLDEVKGYEEKFPEYRYLIVKDENMPDQDDSKLEEWISCDSLAARWKCSPFDVVDILSDDLLRLDGERSYNTTDYDALSGFRVHRVDLMRFEIAYAERIAFLSGTVNFGSDLMAKAEKALGESLSSPYQAIEGLLKLFDGGNEMTEEEVQAEQKSRPTKSPARIRDYTNRMPGIVKGVLDVKEKWDKTNSFQIKNSGFSEGELREIAPQIKNKELLKAFKHALADAGIKVHFSRSPRPTQA